MATRRNSISLDFEGSDDGLTAVVRKTERSMEDLAGAVSRNSQKTQAAASENRQYTRTLDQITRRYDPAKAAGKSYERQVAALNRALDQGKIDLREHGRYLKGVEKDYDKAKRGAGGLTRSQNQLSTSSRGLSAGLSGIASHLSLAAAGYGAWKALRAADDFLQLESRIKLATAGFADYNQTQTELYELTQRNGAAFGETVALYQNLARTAPELGKNNEQVLQLTNAVQQLGVVSGTSAEAQKNALQQFSQAMAGGIVRAEEWNSIVENTPSLAQAIADGMDTSIGKLRLAVVEGTVLSEDVFNAILSQTDAVQEKFDQMPVSMDRSATMMRNSFGNLSDAILNDVAGWGGAVGSFGKLLSESLDNWADFIRGDHGLGEFGNKLRDLHVDIVALQDRIEVTPNWFGGKDKLKAELAELRKEYSRVQDAQKEAALATVANGKASAKATGDQTKETEALYTALNTKLNPQIALRNQYEKDRAILQKKADAGDKQALDNLKKLETQLNKQLAAINKNSTATKSATDVVKGWGEAAEKAAEKQRIETEKLIEAEAKRVRSMEDLILKYDDQSRAARTLEEETAAIIAAAFELDLTEQQLTNTLNAATAEIMNFGDEGKDAGDKVKEAADPMAVAWENAIKSMDDAGRDMWRGFMDDGKLSMDGVEDLFKNLIAEMLHQAFTADIGNALMGGGGSGGGFNPMSLLSGFSGGSAGFTPMEAFQMARADGGSILSAGLGGFSAAVSKAIPPLLAFAATVGIAKKIFSRDKHEVRGDNLNLNYSGGDLTGSRETYIRHGGSIWGPRYETILADIDDELKGYIDTSLDGFSDYAKQIGEALNPDGIFNADRISYSAAGMNFDDAYESVNNVVNGLIIQGALDIRGLSEEDAQARVDEWIQTNGAMMLKAVMPEFGGTIDAAVATGDLEEMLAPLLEIGTFLGAELVPTVTLSLSESVAAAAANVREAASGYDGTLATVQEMGDAVNQELLLRQQMTDFIAAAKQSMSDSLMGLSESIRRDITPIADLFKEAYLQVETNLSEIATANTAADVLREVDEFKTAASEAWRLGQQALNDELRDQLAQFSDPEDVRQIQEDYDNATKDLAGNLRDSIAEADDISRARMDEFDAENNRQLEAQQQFVRDSVVETARIQRQAAVEAANAIIAATNSQIAYNNQVIQQTGGYNPQTGNWTNGDWEAEDEFYNNGGAARFPSNFADVGG